MKLIIQLINYDPLVTINHFLRRDEDGWIPDTHRENHVN